jgi:phage shock protein A
MKTLVLKLLGLNTLVESLNTLTKENETLKKGLADLEVVVADLETKVDDLKDTVEDIEVHDMDDYVRQQDLDLDTAIYDYLSSNDYATLEEVKDCVEEAVEEIDIEAKVEEVVKGMEKPSFGDTEELKGIVTEVLKTSRFKVE